MDGALRAVLEAQSVNCVLDVGANVGHFAQLIRTLGYAGRIVSFEPSPTALPALHAAAARDTSWKVRPVGLAAEAGLAELHLHTGSEFDSLHATLSVTAQPDAVANYPRLAEVGAATVTLSTLAIEYDGAVAGLNEPRILLKSDTQGHDLDVLAGAPGLPHLVAVFVELSAQHIYEGQPGMAKIMGLLQDEGFAPVAFQPITHALDNLRFIEFDGLFMRPLT
jgi:FkbM family methyltransferase